MEPRRFQLVRRVDPTGVSGTGVVAYGVVFGDGHVVLRWSSQHPATSLWNSLEDMLTVHGHRGSTYVVWIDEQRSGRHRGRQSHLGSADLHEQPKGRHMAKPSGEGLDQGNDPSATTPPDGHARSPAHARTPPEVI